MFDAPYAFRKANTEHPVADKHLICTYNYVFKADDTPYIAKVEVYPNNIYIIKFFRKQDRRRKNRCHILTNEFKCTKIVATCIAILVSILDKNSKASFGFLGSNTIEGNYEELRSETKRFKIYKRAMENLVGNNVFEHSMDVANSTYLMVNKNNSSVDDFINESKVMFDEIFPDLIY